jgi:hypothetical protein
MACRSSRKRIAVTRTVARTKRSKRQAISQRVLIEILSAQLAELLPEQKAHVQEREARQREQIEKLLIEKLLGGG